MCRMDLYYTHTHTYTLYICATAESLMCVCVSAVNTRYCTIICICPKIMPYIHAVPTLVCLFVRLSVCAPVHMQHHLRFTAFTLNLSTFVCLILYQQRRFTTRCTCWSAVCLFFGLLINALIHTHTNIHTQRLGEIACVIVCIARFLRHCGMKIRHICSGSCFCCHFGCCYSILMQAAIFIFTAT